MNINIFRPANLWRPKAQEVALNERVKNREVAQIKEHLKEVYQELEDKTFTIVEGIAYLIISVEKNCPDYEQRLATVIDDYHSLLATVAEYEDDYVQQKNKLHACFKQPPVRSTLKEKVLSDIEKKVQLFSDVFGREEVDKIWHAIRLETVAHEDAFPVFQQPDLALQRVEIQE